MITPNMTPIKPQNNLDLTVRVESVCSEAQGVKSVTLVATEGGQLPPFEAGAHLEVALPTGCSRKILLRQYSLLNDTQDRDRYVIGVGLHSQSRGGSLFIHQQLQPGQHLVVRPPRNRFSLVENAEMSVFIAGGIGVTPLLCMARRLTRLGRPWRFYYCVRTPAHAAFLDQLMTLGGGEVIPIYDGCPGVQRLNMREVMEGAAPGTHFYCCGPAGMMTAFEMAGRTRDPSTLHVEWFEAPAAPEPTEPESDGAIVVHLAKSGITIQVPPHQTILEQLEAAGINVPNSCGDGICGTCETRVVAGRPLHRDHVLTATERERADRMMVCVSRSLDPELTLDL